MNWIFCFIIGGLLCVVAQLLIDKTTLTPAKILVSYVCAGVVLTGIGWYPKLVDFAGCGATVPLTGFGFVSLKVLKAPLPNMVLSEFSSAELKQHPAE